MKPPIKDKFFLDARVYAVKPVEAPDDGERENRADGEELVWRGLYLAIDMGPPETIEVWRNNES